MRAGAGAGAGPGSDSGSGSAAAGAGRGSGSGSLPGLVLFESGLTGMGYAKHTRSAIQIRIAPVATVGSNHCNGSDRAVATFRWVWTRWPLLERYK